MMIETKESAGILTVTLSRPEVRNAFHPELLKKLKDLFSSLSSRTDLSLVVLKGEGKVFCAGADLEWMKAMSKYSEKENLQDAEELFETFKAIWNCPIPILGAVHGAAFGGALGLLACCDEVIATRNTQFCFSEVKLGLAPAVISAFLLKKISLSKLAPWMISGALFSSEDALQMGLVHGLLEDHLLADGILLKQKDYLQAAPGAARATKKLLHAMICEISDDWRKKTTETIAQLRVGAEGQAGLQAFLTKSKPPWGGR